MLGSRLLSISVDSQCDEFTRIRNIAHYFFFAVAGFMLGRGLILSYLILSYLILSYLILSYLILSYLISSHLILSYLIVSYRIVSYRIVSYRILSYLILSYLILSYLILSYLMIQAAELDSHNDNGLDTTRRASYKFVSSTIPHPFFCQRRSWQLFSF